MEKRMQKRCLVYLIRMLGGWCRREAAERNFIGGLVCEKKGATHNDKVQLATKWPPSSTLSGANAPRIFFYYQEFAGPLAQSVLDQPLPLLLYLFFEKFRVRRKSPQNHCNVSSPTFWTFTHLLYPICEDSHCIPILDHHCQSDIRQEQFPCFQLPFHMPQYFLQANPRKLVQLMICHIEGILSLNDPPHLPGNGVKPWHFFKKQFQHISN